VLYDMVAFKTSKNISRNVALFSPYIVLTSMVASNKRKGKRFRFYLSWRNNPFPHFSHKSNLGNLLISLLIIDYWVLEKSFEEVSYDGLLFLSCITHIRKKKNQKISLSKIYIIFNWICTTKKYLSINRRDIGDSHQFMGEENLFFIYFHTRILYSNSQIFHR
jgi:hypothetical protein